MTLRDLSALARRQHGVVAHRQMFSYVSVKQFRVLLERGELERLHHGVYAFTAAPDTWYRDAMAAVLTQPGATLSHMAAAYVFGFGDQRRAPALEISIRRGKGEQIGGVRVHRTIHPDCRTVVAGIPMSTASRTLLDLAAKSSLGELARMLDAALQQRIVDLGRLTLFVRGAGHRRRGVRKLRGLLEERKASDFLLESPLEGRILSWLRTAGFGEPVPQFPIDTSLGRFRLDFAYPRERLAIEVDGWAHHGSRTSFVNDRERDNAIQACGWRVLHVTARSNREHFVRTLSALRA